MNKYSFNVTKYYEKNKKITEFQASCLMLLGFLILVATGYAFYNLIINLESTNEQLNSETDCSQDSRATNANVSIESFYSTKSDYERVKSYYQVASEIDLKVKLMNQRLDEFNKLIDIFNVMVNDYNTNSGYYDYCYTKLEKTIDENRDYLDREQKLTDDAFKALEPQAIAAGYEYDTTD